MSDLKTDPLSELLSLIASLGPSNADGVSTLSRSMGVAPWSTDFFHLLWIVNRRFDRLKTLVSEISGDGELATIAKTHLDAMQTAFSGNGLLNAWQNSLTNFLNPGNVNPLKMLTFQVRHHRSHARLSIEEITSIREDALTLLAWLEEHEDQQSDFIRANLIAGLKDFVFGLEHLSWVGFEGPLDSLREIISAYMALEREVNIHSGGIYEAMLVKTGKFVNETFAKMKIVKDVVAITDLSLKAYGAVSLALQAPALATHLIAVTNHG